MRKIDENLNLELWASNVETPGGYEWTVIHWNVDGTKDFEVSGQDETYARAKINAHVKLAQLRSELLMD